MSAEKITFPPQHATLAIVDQRERIFLTPNNSFPSITRHYTPGTRSTLEDVAVRTAAEITGVYTKVDHALKLDDPHSASGRAYLLRPMEEIADDKPRTVTNGIVSALGRSAWVDLSTASKLIERTRSLESYRRNASVIKEVLRHLK